MVGFRPVRSRLWGFREREALSKFLFIPIPFRPSSPSYSFRSKPRPGLRLPQPARTSCHVDNSGLASSRVVREFGRITNANSPRIFDSTDRIAWSVCPCFAFASWPTRRTPLQSALPLARLVEVWGWTAYSMARNASASVSGLGVFGKSYEPFWTAIPLDPRNLLSAAGPFLAFVEQEEFDMVHIVFA